MQRGFTCIRSCLAKTGLWESPVRHLQGQGPKGLLLYPQLQSRAAIWTVLKEHEWILFLENFITIAFFCQGLLNQTEGNLEEVIHSLQCKIPFLHCCPLVIGNEFFLLWLLRDWQAAVLLSKQHFVPDKNPHVHDLNSDVISSKKSKRGLHQG